MGYSPFKPQTSGSLSSRLYKFSNIFLPPNQGWIYTYIHGTLTDRHTFNSNGGRFFFI
jgi:hypothetical protein